MAQFGAEIRTGIEAGRGVTTIRFYGRAGAGVGREAEFALPAGGCTIGELRRALGERHPEMAAELRSPRLRACVGDAIVDDGRLVREGEEIEFFPPLSGG